MKTEQPLFKICTRTDLTLEEACQEYKDVKEVIASQNWKFGRMQQLTDRSEKLKTLISDYVTGEMDNVL